MSKDSVTSSSYFPVVADSIFQTLLTITTILSGIYISITFGWFSQAMIEPHPGEPMQPEMLTQAMVGIMLGVIFILPLMVILIAWALAKLRNSVIWRTVAWSSLLYCLTQDFIGVVAMFGLPIIAAGAIVGVNFVASALFIILPPLLLGAVLGHRVSSRYPASDAGVAPQQRIGLIAVVTVLALLLMQGVVIVFLFTANT